MPRESSLDNFLQSKDFDAFMMQDTSANSDMYYLTGFEASDPFTYLRKNGESIVLVPPLELSRAKDEAEVDQVVSTSKYADGDPREDEEKQINTLIAFLEDFNAGKIAVPQDFELGLAEDLRDREISLKPVENQVMKSRKQKEPEEIDVIREAQKHTEDAMAKVGDMISNAEVRDDELYLEGEVLTSERIRREIKKFLLDRDCGTPEEPIVASGADSAAPHKTGSGPIKPGEPVIVDIFPQHRKYFGDMTRTFLKGDPSEEVQEMYSAVKQALEAALEVLEEGAGVNSSEIHGKVCDVLEDHGFQTLRDGDIESGFIHSTGHAVGLDLHEPPRLGDNDAELEEGNILTVEPGLYMPELGGMRIEDMIIVQENGYENINSMSWDMKLD